MPKCQDPSEPLSSALGEVRGVWEAELLGEWHPYQNPEEAECVCGDTGEVVALAFCQSRWEWSKCLPFPVCEMAAPQPSPAHFLLPLLGSEVKGRHSRLRLKI